MNGSLRVNESNFDDYSFFPLMSFLGEIVELYLQWNNFLENLKPTVNKETKVKD